MVVHFHKLSFYLPAGIAKRPTLVGYQPGRQASPTARRKHLCDRAGSARSEISVLRHHRHCPQSRAERWSAGYRSADYSTPRPGRRRGIPKRGAPCLASRAPRSARATARPAPHLRRPNGQERWPSALRVSRVATASSERPIRVVDDWPEIVPITKAELRVMEGHFAEELDAMLGPRA